MICSICKKGETSVVDSRPTEDGTAIRRRRLCVCGARFTTFERVQYREIMVVKKNGRKSAFDRDKLSKSIFIALKKRPIDTETTEKFISRIFSKFEISKVKKIKDKNSYYFKRFAAKEAFSKSIGVGFRYNLNFKDITILNDELGKPYFVITEKIKNIIKKKFKVSKFNFFLSISDEKKYSIAYVILQKK